MSGGTSNGQSHLGSYLILDLANLVAKYAIDWIADDSSYYQYGNRQGPWITWCVRSCNFKSYKMYRHGRCICETDT